MFRLKRIVQHDEIQPPPAATVTIDLPEQLTPSGSRRSLPLPQGWSRSEVFELLQTLSIDGAPTSELEGYLNQDFERFLHTWGLVGAVSGQALEIGANPYFTTVLLREFSDLELSLTNSFDPNSTALCSQRVTYGGVGGVPVAESEFEYQSNNIEIATLPYETDSFDVVLFCEVIEHLLSDPVQALLEIKRVLRSGGSLVLTTPNVARLENIARLAAGVNLYDPYSGYGPYGRHNREFTRHELVKLLGFVGFDVPVHFTADVHPHITDSFVDPALLLPMIKHRLEDLGQYLFCSAVNARPAQAGRPSEIYRSMAQASLVTWG
jgi:SAM-dependent methyltransferase